MSYHNMEKSDKLLGICSYCSAIRVSNEGEAWLSRDAEPDLYDRFMQLPNLKLTHGICPDCERKYFPEYANNPKRQKDFPARNPKQDGLAEMAEEINVWPLEIPAKLFR